MTELTTKRINAQKAWRKADKNGRKLLEDLYGKEVFQSQDITDIIQELSDAIEYTGRPDVPEFSELPEDLRPFFQAVYKNVIVAEALNEGERFDLYDESVKRHYPYYYTNGSPSAFAFDSSYYDYSRAAAGSGSRLCLKDGKRAKHMGTRFKDIQRDMLSK